VVKLPDSFILAMRASVLLRGLGKAFGIKLSMSEEWKPQAEAYLKSCGIDY